MLIPCKADSQYRCTANGANGEGQCHYLSLEGMVEIGHVPQDDYGVDTSKVKVCPRHGANFVIDKLKREKLKMYRTGIFKDVAAEFFSNPQATTLTEEIALLRTTLQTTLNMCRQPMDLLMYSNQIMALTKRIESLMVSAERLKEKSNLFMDRARALAFATRLVAMINDKLPENQKYILEAVAEEAGNLLLEEK